MFLSKLLLKLFIVLFSLLFRTCSSQQNAFQAVFERPSLWSSPPSVYAFDFANELLGSWPGVAAASSSSPLALSHSSSSSSSSSASSWFSSTFLFVPSSVETVTFIFNSQLTASDASGNMVQTNDMPCTLSTSKSEISQRAVCVYYNCTLTPPSYKYACASMTMTNSSLPSAAPTADPTMPLFSLSASSSIALTDIPLNLTWTALTQSNDENRAIHQIGIGTAIATQGIPLGCPAATIQVGPSSTSSIPSSGTIAFTFPPSIKSGFYYFYYIPANLSSSPSSSSSSSSSPSNLNIISASSATACSAAVTSISSSISTTTTAMTTLAAMFCNEICVTVFQAPQRVQIVTDRAPLLGGGGTALLFQATHYSSFDFVGASAIDNPNSYLIQCYFPVATGNSCVPPPLASYQSLSTLTFETWFQSLPTAITADTAKRCCWSLLSLVFGEYTLNVGMVDLGVPAVWSDVQLGSPVCTSAPIGSSGYLDSSWHHFSVVFLESSAAIYIDAQQYSESTCNQYFQFATVETIAFGPTFEGYLDEIRLWRTARVPSAISRTRGRILFPQEIDDTLIAYYPMDELTPYSSFSATLVDHSLHSFDITLGGRSGSVLYRPLPVVSTAPIALAAQYTLVDVLDVHQAHQSGTVNEVVSLIISAPVSLKTQLPVLTSVALHLFASATTLPLTFVTNADAYTVTGILSSQLSGSDNRWELRLFYDDAASFSSLGFSSRNTFRQVPPYTQSEYLTGYLDINQPFPYISPLSPSLAYSLTINVATGYYEWTYRSHDSLYAGIALHAACFQWNDVPLTYIGNHSWILSPFYDSTHLLTSARLSTPGDQQYQFGFRASTAFSSNLWGALSQSEPMPVYPYTQYTTGTITFPGTQNAYFAPATDGLLYSLTLNEFTLLYTFTYVVQLPANISTSNTSTIAPTVSAMISTAPPMSAPVYHVDPIYSRISLHAAAFSWQDVFLTYMDNHTWVLSPSTAPTHLLTSDRLSTASGDSQYQFGFMLFATVDSPQQWASLSSAATKPTSPYTQYTTGEVTTSNTQNCYFAPLTEGLLYTLTFNELDMRYVFSYVVVTTPAPATSMPTTMTATAAPFVSVYTLSVVSLPQHVQLTNALGMPVVVGDSFTTSLSSSVALIPIAQVQLKVHLSATSIASIASLNVEPGDVLVYDSFTYSVTLSQLSSFDAVFNSSQVVNVTQMSVANILVRVLFQPTAGGAGGALYCDGKMQFAFSPTMQIPQNTPTTIEFWAAFAGDNSASVSTSSLYSVGDGESSTVSVCASAADSEFSISRADACSGRFETGVGVNTRAAVGSLNGPYANLRAYQLEWMHVAVVSTLNYVTLYINGMPVDGKTQDSTLAAKHGLWLVRDRLLSVC